MGKWTGHIGAILFILAATAFFVAIPFLTLWCLNTLGIASADYGFLEWLASAVLTAMVLSGAEG